MSEVFIYGTMLPGSRNEGRLELLGAEFIREAQIGPGYRMAVQYRTGNDKKFNRIDPNHYVEPILIVDRKHPGLIHGSVYDIDNLDDFQRVHGNPKSTQFAKVNGVHVLVRSSHSNDLIYRTDPCIHRFADGSARFFDQATYLFSNEYNVLPGGIEPTSLGEVEGGYLWQTEAQFLYLFDINAGPNRCRASDMVILSDGRKVPVHTYAER